MSNRKPTESFIMRSIIGGVAVAIAALAYWHIGSLEEKITSQNDAAWIREFGQEYLGFHEHRENSENRIGWSNLLDEKNRAPANAEDCETAIKNGHFGKFVARGIQSVSDPEDIFSAAEQMKTYLQSCTRENPPYCIQQFDQRVKYFASTQAVSDQDLPNNGMMYLPKEILENEDPNGHRIRRDLELYVKSRGWKSVRYRSRHTGGFIVSNPWVMVVHIPGEELDPPQEFDHFVQVQLDKSKQITEQSYPSSSDLIPSNDTVAAISLRKVSDLPKNHVPYFHLHNEGYGFARARIQGAETSSCVSCHNSGTRVISPMGYGHHFEDEPRPLVGTELEQLIQFNQKLMKYGSIDLRGRFRRTIAVASEYGRAPGKENMEFYTDPDEGCASPRYLERQKFTWTPIWSSRGPTRTFRYSGQPVNPHNVMEGTTVCTACHDSSTRGRLTNDLNDIVFKVLGDRMMPGVIELTEDERFAVVACLDKAKNMRQTEKMRRLTLVYRLGLSRCQDER